MGNIESVFNGEPLATKKYVDGKTVAPVDLTSYIQKTAEGQVNLPGKLCIGPETNQWCFNPIDRDGNGFLELAKTGATDAPDNSYYLFSGDGNLWLNRSSQRGWIADNMATKAINGAKISGSELCVGNLCLTDDGTTTTAKRGETTVKLF